MDTRAPLGGSAVKHLPANAGDIVGSIPGLGRSPGEGNGSPLQFHGQRSLVARVHKVAKSRTQLSN